MKNQLSKPWLTNGGVELPSEQLKRICQGWDTSTWQRYLKWYAGGRREALISSDLYSEKCDQITENIFSTFGFQTSHEKTKLCGDLLRQLPAIESEVLLLSFLEGKSEREIAAIISRSQPGVHQIKNRALLRIKRGLRGNEVITRRYMGDEDSAREEKVNDHKNFKNELSEIRHRQLCQAVDELSERQQKIIYLRFWCCECCQDKHGIFKKRKWPKSLAF